MALMVSMVLLRDDTPLTAVGMQQELASLFPDLPAAKDLEEKENTISLNVGDAMVILGKMPGPIPWSDLEGPCATSILWPKATTEVREHTIHWIVTVSGELDPLELSTLLTQASAAAMSACSGSIGVYWDNSTMVIPKPLFIDFAKEILPLGPPLPIWVDLRIGQVSDQRSAGFTTGMKALGHMEFETEDSPEPPGELRDRFLALANYVIEHGPVIRDGDTVGEDEDERIRVVYAKSAYGQEGQVMRLEYENASPQKPWWKLW